MSTSSTTRDKIIFAQSGKPRLGADDEFVVAMGSLIPRAADLRTSAQRPIRSPILANHAANGKPFVLDAEGSGPAPVCFLGNRPRGRIIPEGSSICSDSENFGWDKRWSRPRCASSPPVPRGWQLQKTGSLAQFVSSLKVMVREPAPPKKFLGGPYFRDCWIDQRFPKQAFATAVALQVLLIVFPPPIWSTRPPRVVAPQPEMELTWFGPAHDLPAISPAVLRLKSAPKIDAAKTRRDRGADAFHPRQTILSTPLHPTHPRQTLIQPAAPQEPPKILPALPNIVQIAASQPARPRVTLTAMHPAEPSHLAAPDASAPDLAVPDKHLGAITIASSAQAPPKPLLPVSPMSAPRAGVQRSETSAAAPEISGKTGDTATVIALSATPAPAPPPAIPAGNLSARISISPDGPQPGATPDSHRQRARPGRHFH